MSNCDIFSGEKNCGLLPFQAENVSYANLAE